MEAKAVQKAEGVVLPRGLNTICGMIASGLVPNLRLLPQQPSGTNLLPNRTRSGRPTQKERETARARKERESPREARAREKAMEFAIFGKNQELAPEPIASSSMPVDTLPRLGLASSRTGNDRPALPVGPPPTCPSTSPVQGATASRPNYCHLSFWKTSRGRRLGGSCGRTHRRWGGPTPSIVSLRIFSSGTGMCGLGIRNGSQGPA